MKNIVTSLTVLSLVLFMGMPFAHGLTPKIDKQAFGQAVSGLAHVYPGAVADHIAN